MTFEKNNIRKKFIQIRNKISNLRRPQAEKQISNLVINSSKILSFASKDSEINLWPLNIKLAKENRLLLPKIQNNDLLIYEVTNINTQLIKNKFDIFEPDDRLCKQINEKQISCVLIPALAFDKTKNRIGYGKGFYDRFLSKIKCLTIGIGYNEQLSSDLLPTENHDIAVDQLLLF